MNSLKHMVSSFLRLLAVGLLLLGIALIAVGWIARRQGEGGTGSLLFGVIGCGAGVLLLVFSSALARRLTRDYE